MVGIGFFGILKSNAKEISVMRTYTLNIQNSNLLVPSLSVLVFDT